MSDEPRVLTEEQIAKCEKGYTLVGETDGFVFQCALRTIREREQRGIRLGKAGEKVAEELAGFGHLANALVDALDKKYEDAQQRIGQLWEALGIECQIGATHSKTAQRLQQNVVAQAKRIADLGARLDSVQDAWRAMAECSATMQKDKQIYNYAFRLEIKRIPKLDARGRRIYESRALMRLDAGLMGVALNWLTRGWWFNTVLRIAAQAEEGGDDE